jgi:hypothetical protein
MMGYPTVLLGLLGRAGAIILGQLNRGLCVHLCEPVPINLKAQQTLS